MTRHRFLVVGFLGDASDVVGSFPRRRAAQDAARDVNGYDRVEVVDTMARRGQWSRWAASGYPLEFRSLTEDE